MMHDPYSRMALGMSVGVAGIALGAGASTVFGDRSQK
jgi:hypothetical protein